MEKMNLRAEQALANANETREEGLEESVRTLRDLELLLVGGGDGTSGWP